MPGSSREVVYLSDWRGGLNLTENQQNLEANQSPDCVNIDFGLRGGVLLRGGFNTVGKDTLLSGAQFIGPIYFTTDVLLMSSSSGDLLTWDGSTLTDTTNNVTDDGTQRVRYSVYANSTTEKAYFHNCYSSSNLIAQSYDGTTLSTLTNSWNNDYLNPTTGNMPLAKFGARFNDHLFVANTVESATSYPHRLRWSHLGYPESWAEADYVEVDASDEGDPITALYPMKDRLLIFKRSSVYALFGDNRDNFQLEQVAKQSGTCTCGAMAGSSKVAYWFSTDGQLMAYDGRGAVPVTDALRYWADVGKIKHGGAHRLMWSDGRLWMRLESGEAGTDYWLFVYDPSIKAMTRYQSQLEDSEDYDEITDLIHWEKIGEDADPLFLVDGSKQMFRYDRSYATDSSARDVRYDCGSVGSNGGFAALRMNAVKNNDANANVTPNPDTTTTYQGDRLKITNSVTPATYYFEVDSTANTVDDGGLDLNSVDSNWTTATVYGFRQIADETVSDTFAIRGRYRTSWLTAGETATRKRWKRPRITAAADGDATITVKVFHDFDPVTTEKSDTFYIDIGDASSWGTMNWGDDWSSGADFEYEFERLTSSGTAYAIQYEFTSLDNTSRWWVDSIAQPFRRKQVR